MKVRNISILLFAYMSFSIFLTSLVECGHHCFKLERKYRNNCVKSGALNNLKLVRNVDSEAIVNNIDVNYMVLINVGTPPQRLKFSLSLLESDTWLVSSDCNTTTCLPRKKFANKNSSTFELEGMPFSYFKAIGLTAYDYFYISHLKIHHRFALINNLTGYDYTFQQQDGVLGLGYVSRTNANLPWIVENAYQQGVIERKVFAIWFNPNQDDPNGGEFTFGGINKRHYRGKISYINMTGVTTWQIQVNKVDIKINRTNTISLCDGSETGCRMRFDPSYLYTYGPKAEFDSINKALGGIYDSNFNVYTFNCSAQGTLPDLVFHITDNDGKLKAFPIRSSNYIIYEEGYGCYSGLIGIYDIDFILTNTMFLSEYYTIFDYDRRRVGISKAKAL